jgi:hypothetical protein
LGAQALESTNRVGEEVLGKVASVSQPVVSCVMQKVSRFAKNFFAKILINNSLGFGTFFAFCSSSFLKI